MAYAQKGDPLKKQKDSLNIKNKAVEFWTAALLENTGRYVAGKVAKEVRKHNPLTKKTYFDTTKPKPKKKNPMGRK